MVLLKQHSLEMSSPPWGRGVEGHCESGVSFPTTGTTQCHPRTLSFDRGRRKLEAPAEEAAPAQFDPESSALTTTIATFGQSQFWGLTNLG